MIRVFLDETGEFRPCAVGKHELSSVFALIVPELASDPLRHDFSKFVSTLPRGAFVNGEPKGNRLTFDRQRSLASSRDFVEALRPSGIVRSTAGQNQRQN